MLNFLAAHYEKVILASLLIVFAVLLLWQVNFLQAGQSSDVDKILQKQEPPTDQVAVDFSAPKFDQKNIFFGNTLWHPSHKENTRTNPRTELFSCFKLSLCPFCLNLISTAFFPEKGSTESFRCPISSCQKELVAKQKRIVKIEINPEETENSVFNPDKNNNGIPDEWEKKVELYSENADDIDRDHDHDFFSTREEYEYHTDPKDAKSHPKYIDSISVRRITKRPFKDLKFRGVDDFSDPNINNWTFKLEYKDPAKRNSQIGTFKIGDRFTNDKETFVFLSAEPDNKDKPGDGTVIYLCREGYQEKIRCEKKKAVFDPVDVVTLSCDHPKGNIVKKIGEEFSRGNKESGEEKYKIISASVPHKTVVVQNLLTKEMMTLTENKKTKPVEKRILNPALDPANALNMPSDGLQPLTIPPSAPRSKRSSK